MQQGISPKRSKFHYLETLCKFLGSLEIFPQLRNIPSSFTDSGSGQKKHGKLDQRKNLASLGNEKH